MARAVKLSRVGAALTGLTYPISREDAIRELDDITLLLADGEENLGDTVSRANTDSFESAEELESEVYNNLPTEAVGEPGQSEGEG